MIRLSAAFLLSTAIGAQALAQSSRGQDQPEQPIQTDPLAGPTVAPEASKKTLVSFDYNGRLRRLEVPAEEAALDLVDLDAATRAKVDRILAERGAILDKVVAENLDLLIKLHTAREAGDTADKVRLLKEFADKAAPLRQRGRLRDEIVGALPADMVEPFTALVNEYWEAVLKDGAKDLPESTGRSRGSVAAREVLVAFGQEIKRSYERQIAAKAGELDEFVRTLGLAGEQETRVRNILTGFYRETKGKATAAQKREMVVKLMAELDADQKQILIQKFLKGPDR